MTEMIEYVIIIYSASNWIFFSYVLNKDVPILCLIGFAISCLNAVLPMVILINYKKFSCLYFYH